MEEANKELYRSPPEENQPSLLSLIGGLPRKIAVLRANGLGDFIFSLPAFDALRAAYPESELILLGLPWHRSFLQGRPGPIDRVVVIPPADGGLIGLINTGNDDPFFTRMRAEKFDLALQLHGGGRHSNPFIKRLQARAAVGLKAPDAEPLDLWVPYVFFQSEVLRFLEVAAAAGAPPVTIEPRLSIAEVDLEEADSVVPGDGPPLIAINPNAGHPTRRWPAHKFAVVGDALVRAGARVVITGLEEEKAVVQSVASAMKKKSAPLAGRLSLRGLAGLYSRCSLVVSNDSGPLHLARAVGCPTVGIYWFCNMINVGPVVRSWHHSAIAWRMNCPECGADWIHAPCRHEHSRVADISAEEVVALSLELLAKKRS